MLAVSRRALLAASVVLAAFGPVAARAADAVAGITIDWAYYNPVSLVLKDKGWLEEALKPQGVSVTWVQSAGSNKAIEFLNSGSVQFGSAAGAAALLARINGSPIKAVYAFSKPEWTALVTNGDSPIQSVEDLKGKRVAVTRGTDPYIFLLRALADHGLTEQDIEVVLLQHADGRNALIAHQVDAWAGLDPMMAQAELEQGARLFYRKPDLNTYGLLNVNEQFATDHPEIVEAVIRAYERARRYSAEHPDELRAALVDAAGLTDAAAAKQLERTDLSNPAIDAPKRDTILNAGLALQKAGVIDASVDVAATVDALLDARFKTALAN
jgi:sulfonate transport system substrate-binding protein